MARPGRPGVLMGLVPRSDLPVMSHAAHGGDPEHGRAFGKADWNSPGSVSVTAYGDLLAIEPVEGVAADDSAALYDLTGFIGQALNVADGWPARQPPLPELPSNWQTIEWLLGIVLPILFIGIGTWALLAESLTNRRNARRALLHTYAEVARHRLWYRRADARLKRRSDSTTRRHERADRRVKRFENAAAAAASARKAVRARKEARVHRAKRRRDALAGRKRRVQADQQAAEREADAAKTALLVFARAPDHVREWDPGAFDDVDSGSRSSLGDAGGKGDPDGQIARLIGSTRLRRMWLPWAVPFLDLAGTPRMWHPRDRSRSFVCRMRVLARRLLCWRRYHEKVLNVRKVDARKLIGGVWEGVWGSLTDRRGVAALTAGIVSVVAAVALSVSGTFDWDLGPEPLKPALQAGLVIGAYLAFAGREHGRPMVWGAAAVTMLGLTTIEFTTLKEELGDVFDSQRVTLVQLVVVAMLFMGRAFFQRRNPIGPERAESGEQAAEAERDACLEKIGGDPDEGFGKRVRAAGARFTRFEKRERLLVFAVIVLYLAICLHFFHPALRWDGLRPSGWAVEGDAADIVVVAATVTLLPVLSLWGDWRAAVKRRDPSRSASAKAVEDGRL